MSWWSRMAAVLMLGLIAAGLYGALSSLLGGGPHWTADPCDRQRPSGKADLRNGQSFIQDDLWTTGDRQFAVWVGPDGTPFTGVRRQCSTAWQQTDLASLAGNPLGAPTGNDLHDVYAVAVDSLGYVHIVGNMHGQPLRYIRSQYPGEITSWQAGQIPGPTDSVTYPQFTLLPNGTLLFWYREGVAGRGRILLDALDPGMVSWRSVGTILDDGPAGESPYLHHIAVDPRSGTIHLMFEWRLDVSASTTNDVGYAQSRDGGQTWQTATGAPLTTPIGNAPSSTVLETARAGSGLENGGGLTVDSHGFPHGIVVFAAPDGTRLLDHIWFDGRRWHTDPLDGKTIDGRPGIAGTRDGRMWLLGALGDRLDAVEVTPGRSHERRELSPVPPGWEATYDSQALALQGRIQSLVPDRDRPAVVEAAAS
jgi:hypothetical protein